MEINKGRKFDKSSNKGVFLGYSTTSKGYIVYDTSKNRAYRRVNVYFDDVTVSQPVENKLASGVIDLSPH